MATSRALHDFIQHKETQMSKTYVKRILVLSDSYRQLYPTAG